MKPSAPAPAASFEARLDPSFHAALARASTSLSAESLLLAAFDWAVHLATSPGKRMDLVRLALDQAHALSDYARSSAIAECRGAPCGDPPVADARFAGEDWRGWPFNLEHQAFLLTERWWAAATHGVWGVSPHHENVVSFTARQWLDTLSPANQLLTNPQVLRQTFEQCGLNLVRGALYALDDAERALSGARAAGTEQFAVGRDVAVTPGKVVFKNRLIELIQYAPATPKVHAQPVLVVPAWIMKYYILDLSPHNSLIRYLVEQGHTVFCISWKNPDADDRDLGMDDYYDLGIVAALDAIARILPRRKVHAAGYCLGGTLLAIAAAEMAHQRRAPFASMTLFAAQTDFSEPGELQLFIDDSQVSLLEAQMNEVGYLTAGQMAGAFQILRSNDLLWSRILHEYLMGERNPMGDLMAWNADATRMPARMHSQYLRRLFLDNDLSAGRYPVHGHPISLGDVDLPVFCVGTVTDHIAPWRSVYKLHRQVGSELTFVLTSGGHNAGIVSEPGHPHRSYQIHTRVPGEPYMAPEEWQAQAQAKQGSWWPEWAAWLKPRSGALGTPPPMGIGGKPLADAPGEYVLAR